MWIRTTNGMINLAHAFETSYDAAQETLTVWWTMNLPAEADRSEMASMYDTARLCYYGMPFADWEYFQQRASR